MKRILFIVYISCLAGMTCAQSLEERYRAFQQSAQKDYSDFRKQANQKYARFLRAAWDYYKIDPAITPPQERPVPPVPYKTQEDSPAPKPLPYDETTPIQTQPQPAPIAPVIENDESSIIVQITLYGTKLSFRHPRTHRISLSNSSNEAFAHAWEELSTPQYDNLVYDCLKARDDYQLCDWAYIQMLKRLAEQIYGSSNEAVLLSAFLYAQSGYSMRLAISERGKLYMLIGSLYQLYDQRYFELDGTYFYPMEPVEEGLRICNGTFDKEQPMTIFINPEQRFALSSATSPERISEQGISAKCTINQNALAFYNEYPTGQIGGDCGTRWANYANAPMEECVRLTLYPALQTAIRGLSEQQAVAKLLNWVQTAFEYEYDDKVWGHDRALFPSETLYYPYADCEDRAILFSRVVRDILGLDVALLYYPGHLATAVSFNQEVKGDYILLNNRRFVVCDPTYIGAPVGATMPGMDNQTAKVILLKR